MSDNKKGFLGFMGKGKEADQKENGLPATETNTPMPPVKPPKKAEKTKKKPVVATGVRPTVMVAAHPGEIFVVPVSGKKIDAKGTVVPHTPYWSRRIENGDVLEIKEGKPNVKKDKE